MSVRYKRKMHSSNYLILLKYKLYKLFVHQNFPDLRYELRCETTHVHVEHVQDVHVPSGN